jgi:hypothetical protein
VPKPVQPLIVPILVDGSLLAIFLGTCPVRAIRTVTLASALWHDKSVATWANKDWNYGRELLVCESAYFYLISCVDNG